MIEEELRKIKKIYGEEMMHLCRKLFPTVLNNSGVLLNILENTFAPTRTLAIDIINNELEEEFKNFILSFIPKTIDITSSVENPFELMDKAGYVLYECKNEQDIQSFRKYYRDDDVICTITRGNRLKRCFVFFAVRKNVSEIRSNCRTYYCNCSHINQK